MCCLWCYVLARLESNVTRTCGILAQCSVELYSQISLSMRCYETECMQFLRYQCNLKRNHNFYNHCMYLIQIEKTLSDSKTLILTFFQVSSYTSHIIVLYTIIIYTSKATVREPKARNKNKYFKVSERFRSLNMFKPGNAPSIFCVCILVFCIVHAYTVQWCYFVYSICTAGRLKNIRPRWELKLGPLHC